MENSVVETAELGQQERRASQKQREELASIGEAYNHFDDKTGGFIRHLEVAARLISEGSGGSLLELGCGSGIMTRHFAEHFGRVVVVDGSKSYLERTQKYVSKDSVKYIWSLFDDLKCDETFDHVVLAHVLEHMDDPERLIDIAKKHLNPRGKIHIVFPNARSLHRRMGAAMDLISALKYLDEDQKGRGYRHLFSIPDVVDMVERRGLDVMDMRGVYVRMENLSFIKKHYTPEQLDGLFELPDYVPQDLWTECYIRAKIKA